MRIQQAISSNNLIKHFQFYVTIFSDNEMWTLLSSEQDLSSTKETSIDSWHECLFG